MTAALLACSSCWNPIVACAQPVRLFDLAFHEVCAPRCRACGSRLTADAEDQWTYHGKVMSDISGYSLNPTEFWCDGCRDLHGYDDAFAQG